MQRIAFLTLIPAALMAAACSGGAGKEEARSSRGPGGGGAGSVRAIPPTLAPSGAGASAGPAAWIDPEPPGAQAAAEAVVGAPWNEDKVTQLKMTITTLENRTTGLQGFQTGLAAAGTSLDERLSRLGAEVTGTEVTIRLPGSVLFDFDSAEVRPDAARTLSEVAAVIKGYAPRPVRIEGHTDAIASDEYNQKLSERRANAVSAWLVAHGSEKPRLTARGYGESKPAADNATPEGRQRNRRVEVIIEKGS